MNRRIATHRVCRLCPAKTGKGVVRWMESCVLQWEHPGDSVHISPFCRETEATEWLPGLVILSPFPIERQADESIEHLIERCLACGKASMSETSPLFFPPAEYVYWVTPFNVSAMQFLPDSRLLCLNPF